MGAARSQDQSLTSPSSAIDAQSRVASEGVPEYFEKVWIPSPGAWSDRQLQDQRRVVGEPGDQLLVGIVNADGASGQSV